MAYMPMAGFAILAGAAVWVAAIMLGWLLNRRTTRGEGSVPESFNWRLLVNPGLYYEWVGRHNRADGRNRTATGSHEDSEADA